MGLILVCHYCGLQRWRGRAAGRTRSRQTALTCCWCIDWPRCVVGLLLRGDFFMFRCVNLPADPICHASFIIPKNHKAQNLNLIAKTCFESRPGRSNICFLPLVWLENTPTVLSFNLPPSPQCVNHFVRQCVSLQKVFFNIFFFLGAFEKFSKNRPLVSSYLSVFPSAWNSSAPTRQIFVKFQI